jgi:hypothetical protein
MKEELFKMRSHAFILSYSSLRPHPSSLLESLPLPFRPACATIFKQTSSTNESSREESVHSHMSENENAITESAAADSAPEQPEASAPPAEAVAEDITYHAVEKDGQVTAIWEMQGRKHLRTIDPRSRQGQDILRLYTAEHHDEPSATE